MTHTAIIHNYLCNNGEKLFWAVAPAFWGALVWFLAYGPGTIVPITYPIRQLIGILILVAYFYKTLQYTSSHNQVRLFDYPFPIPNWKSLIGITILSLILYRIYLQFYSWGFMPVFDSLVFAVLAGVCLEELITHTFFLKYHMTGTQFIIFNLISSLAFSIMHLGYEPTLPSLQELLLRGYFEKSFLFGLITYKTRRIEIAMILHMTANFINTTLPIFTSYQLLPTILIILWTCFEFLILGATHTIKKK